MIVTKKQFSSNYCVLVFVSKRTEDKDGKVISPEFSTKTKADAYAFKLMTKNPNGIA